VEISGVPDLANPAEGGTERRMSSVRAAEVGLDIRIPPYRRDLGWARNWVQRAEGFSLHNSRDILVYFREWV
jgi:hypothetical protein